MDNLPENSHQAATASKSCATTIIRTGRSNAVCYFLRRESGRSSTASNPVRRWLPSTKLNSQKTRNSPTPDAEKSKRTSTNGTRGTKTPSESSNLQLHRLRSATRSHPLWQDLQRRLG